MCSYKYLKIWSMNNNYFWSYREKSDTRYWIVQFHSVFFFMSCLWGENDRSLKNDDSVFKKQGRIMFFIPDKIAYFTDEVAKSRIKIFQLWRKLLAFTFRFIKTNTLYFIEFHIEGGYSFILKCLACLLLDVPSVKWTLSLLPLLKLTSLILDSFGNLTDGMFMKVYC